MSPELFNTYVDRLLGAMGVFVLVLIALAFLLNFYCWVKEKRKQRKIAKEQHYQDLINSANRKTQVVNKQIQSLDRCSEEIEKLTETLNQKTDSFIQSLHEKLLQYRETASILKDIDGSIRKSVSIIKENTLMNSIENLTEILDKKANLFIHTLEKSTSEYKETSNLLRNLDSNINLSATSISESAILLEKRDRELQNEISCLLSLEGKTEDEIDFLLRTHKRRKKNRFGLQFNRESELAFYLDYSVDFLPIPTIGKKVLEKQFKCKNLEDILSVMLIQQRKGLLLNIPNMGKKTVVAMEDYFCEIGLLTIRHQCYTSVLSI